MPISFYELATAITESADNSIHSGSVNIMPMDIPETMGICESIEFVNTEIMDEAVEFSVFSNNIDDIMFEASIKRPEALAIISEGVIGNVVSGVKKFFQKIIAGVKAIINRIREFFAKFSGKTDKWCALIEPRLKAALQKNPKIGETVVELHPWKEDMILSGMRQMAEDAMTGQSNKKVEEIIKADNLVPFTRMDGTDFSNNSEQINKAIDTINKEIEKINEANKDVTKDTISGIRGGCATVEDLFASVDKEVRGGEKTDTKIGNRVNGMFEYIKKASKNGTELEKAYTGYANKLEKLRKDWESKIDKLTVSETQKKAASASRYGAAYNNIVNNDNKVEAGKAKDKEAAKGKVAVKAAPEAYLNKYQEYVRSKANGMMKALSVITSVAGGLQSRNLSYLSESTKEYMTAITKVAGNGKAPKE